MNRVSLLLATGAATLRRFDHPPGDEHADPEWETARTCSISIVEAGSFDIELEGRQWRFSPGSIFVAGAGMGYRCSHDQAVPVDRCLSVSFPERTVEDLLRADVAAPRPPFAFVSARLNYLRHRLERCGPGDELRFELLAGALFESLGVDAAGGATRAVRAAGRTTDLMRRIDRAVELIESSYARPLALDELAREAGLSSFHFARVFREMMGLPPHRYLTAVRLRHAARMLEQGATVTHVCYDVGFGSLSHFVTAFRRRFGVSPSRVKRGTAVAPLRSSLASPVWGRSASA